MSEVINPGDQGNAEPPSIDQKAAWSPKHKDRAHHTHGAEGHLITQSDKLRLLITGSLDEEVKSSVNPVLDGYTSFVNSSLFSEQTRDENGVQVTVPLTERIDKAMTVAEFRNYVKEKARIAREKVEHAKLEIKKLDERRITLVKGLEDRQRELDGFVTASSIVIPPPSESPTEENKS